MQQQTNGPRQPFYQTLQQHRWGSRDLKDQADFVFKLSQGAVDRILPIRQHYRRWLKSEVQGIFCITDWQELEKLKKQKLVETGSSEERNWALEIPKRSVPAAEEMRTRLDDRRPLSAEDIKDLMRMSGDIIAQAKNEDWACANAPKEAKKYSSAKHYKIRELATVLSYLVHMHELAENCRLTELYEYCTKTLPSLETTASKFLAGGKDRAGVVHKKDTGVERLEFYVSIWKGQEKELLKATGSARTPSGIS